MGDRRPQHARLVEGVSLRSGYSAQTSSRHRALRHIPLPLWSAVPELLPVHFPEGQKLNWTGSGPSSGTEVSGTSKPLALYSA